MYIVKRIRWLPFTKAFSSILKNVKKEQINLIINWGELNKNKRTCEVSIN